MRFQEKLDELNKREAKAHKKAIDVLHSFEVAMSKLQEAQ